MSNYSKTTNFAIKDALLAGDPLKVIKGTDHDTEYNNIATAVATKTDNAAAAIVGGSINATTIGNATPSTGAFTTLAGTTISASGQITSTVATGSAPLVIASTTQVSNLNASQLVGATWAIPLAIGSTTPAAGAFTTLNASGAIVGTSSAVWGTGAANFGMVTKVKNTTQTAISNTTLADDTELQFAIGANEEWTGIAEYTFDASTSMGGPGVRTALVGQQGGGAQRSWTTMIPDNTATLGSAQMSSAGSGTAVFTSGFGSAVACAVRIVFHINNGATPGTVKMQFAQGASNAQTLTLRAGLLQATRVA